MQLFSMNHVDLVITDQLLPDRSGGELAWEMKRLKPDVPIILYTGMEDPPSGGEHADLVLVKGVDPREFLAIIAKLVARSRDPRTGTS
jgi:DNA-binding response OmpR family regulator